MKILTPIGHVNGNWFYQITRNEKIVFITYINGQEVSFDNAFLMKKFLSLNGRAKGG